jgi:hypothetical protein
VFPESDATGASPGADCCFAAGAVEAPRPFAGGVLVECVELGDEGERGREVVWEEERYLRHLVC